MSFDAVNTAATFDPQFETPEGEEHDGSRPCLTVAGVQVYAYVQNDGTLRVSLDFDTADPDVFGEGDDGAALNVPVQLALSGQPVYRIDRNGDEWFGRAAEGEDVDPATRDPYAYPAGYDTVTDAHGA
jgi:hypothetical protein